MANVCVAAVLLSGILAVSGCAGLIPGLEALGAGGGGGYPYDGGGQAYPYDPGQGGGYAQPVQPYYQPQAYAYSGNPEVYYQQVPQATQVYTAGPSGRWVDWRQQRQQERIYQGRAAGHLTPGEARRWRNGPAHIRGAERRMRAHGNLNHQERPRFNARQNSKGQYINRQGHNGVQPGPRVQPRPARPGRPAAHLRTAAQPRAAMQPRAAAQPRAHGGRPARHNGTAP
jgi:hypothetical protein